MTEWECPDTDCQIKHSHYHLIDERLPFSCDSCGAMLIVDVGYIRRKGESTKAFCVWNQAGEYLTSSVDFLTCCPGYGMSEEEG